MAKKKAKTAPAKKTNVAVSTDSRFQPGNKKPAKKKTSKGQKSSPNDQQAWERGEGVECAKDESE